METSYKEVFEFVNEAFLYLKDNKGEEGKETKFELALESLIEQGNENVARYNKALKKIQLKHAAEDPKTRVILRNAQGGYEFTRSGEEACEADIEKLYAHVGNVEIEPEYLDEIPEDIPKNLKRKLKDFIIISA